VTSKNLIGESQELEVTFNYKFEGYEEGDFVVRPVLSKGLIKIFNQESEEWVLQSDLWTSMPQLQKTMNIKLDFNGSSDLYFQIQNTTNAQIYETPRQTVWSENLYSGYLETLNKNIKMYALRQESPKKDPKTNKTYSDQQKRIGLFAKVIKYIGEII
jgi:hypothetical protein